MVRLPPLPPDLPDRPSAPRGASLGPCPLCGREMVAGPSVDLHHWVPKSRGGWEAAPMHRVCHRAVHAALDEREIADAYATPEALRAHPEIAAFLRWVRAKPPEFTARTARRRGRAR